MSAREAGRWALAAVLSASGSIATGWGAPGEPMTVAGDATLHPAGPQPLWTTLADGPWISGNAQPTCALRDASPGIFVDTTGEFYVSGVATSSDRYFLLKFGADGDLLWQKGFEPGAGNPSAPLLFHRSSGEPRVGILVPAYLGYAVRTFRSDGTDAWTSTLQSDSNREPYSATAAVFSEDGHVYVAGARHSPWSFIARHSGDGPADWAIDEPVGSLYGLALTGLSGVVTASSGYGLPAILRHDPQGLRIWQRELVDEEGRRFFAGSLEVEASGQIFFAGSSCAETLCRPALGSLDAGGGWLWSSVPEAASGSEGTFASFAVGSGKVHGLLGRAVSSEDFVDIFSYEQSGLFLGVQTLGPFSSVASAAPIVDSLGWLRFTGRVSSNEGQGYLLAALSPGGVLTYSSYRPVGVVAEGGCDLAEGREHHMLVVGKGFRYADEDLFLGAFDSTGTLVWDRREPDLESPNDSPSSRIGQPRKSPAAHRAADGSLWVVGNSRRGQGSQAQPVGWHFSPTGALQGTVAPFGLTNYNQWATRAVPLPGGGMAMGGVTNFGVRLPFVASFSSDETETMRKIDTAAGRGSTEALFRAANGDFLGVENSFSTGEWSTELVQISATGELLARIGVDPLGLSPYDAVMAEDETIWTAGPIFGQGEPGMDCAVSGASVAAGPVWSHSFGDPLAADYCSAIDAHGGRIVVGATVLENAVIKSFRADGTVEWTVDDLSEAGEAWRLVDEVVLDESGDVYLSGSTQGTYTHRLAKLSPEGVPLWNLPDDLLGGHALSLALGANGGVFALHEPTYGPLLLFRFTAEGAVSWATSLTLPYKTVTATPDGHLILTGSTFNRHSYDLLVSVFDVADFLFSDGFESGDVTGWSGGESLSD